MAPSLVYSALALIFLCICKADLIQKVCPHSRNPPLCIQTLTSDLRSRGADLRVLGDISIDKSLPATQVVKNIAEKKYRKSECIEFANYAVGDLRDCKSLLKTAHDPFNISTLKVNAVAAFVDVDTCIDIYGKDIPAEMKQATSLAMDLIGVLLAVVSFL